MKSNIIFQKKNIKELIKKISLIKECISVNIVGSFTENVNLNKIGDLDIVIISTKLSKRLIDKCKSKLKKHKFPTTKKISVYFSETDRAPGLRPLPGQRPPPLSYRRSS